MGLDVYAVRPNRSELTDMTSLLRLPAHQRDEIDWLPPSRPVPFGEIPRERATGGLPLPSDGDPCGFRGQVYEPWLAEAFELSLYQPFDPEDVRTLLLRLDDWLSRAEQDQVTAPLLDQPDDGYALARIRSLVTFVRASARQQLWFHPDF